ncbi:hypothetical protein LCGC14_0811700 [marine sediment metagenome]|uniref:Uncharacterized protein n=1 Tax=marine sediment metagenome TaxID=412755 RepID=A0A0F9Q6Q3_9ZZZZ
MIGIRRWENYYGEVILMKGIPGWRKYMREIYPKINKPLLKEEFLQKSRIEQSDLLKKQRFITKRILKRWKKTDDYKTFIANTTRMCEYLEKEGME